MTSATVSPRAKYLILAAACLLLLIQAATLLPVRWVEDESWYSIAAHTLATTGELRMPVFAEGANTARVDTRPPLTAMLMAGVFKLAGTSLYSAKLPFLLAGVIAILLTYLLGCEIGGVWVGLIGAMALATDNLFFLATRTARPETLASSFAILGILLFLYSQRLDSPQLAFFSGLVVGLGSVAHLNAFAAAISAGVLAILEFRWAVLRRARPWWFVAGLLLPIAVFLGWALSDAVHRAEFVRMYAYGEGGTLADIPHRELVRYRDFLGFSSFRVKLPIQVPMRLHIALALLFSAGALYRYNRKLLGKIGCLILPAMAWWAYERNATPRYIATGSAYLALLISGAAVALIEFKPRWRKAVTAVAALMLLSQVAGNFLLLYTYRQANYQTVTRQLREIIPAKATVYGAITFWMALCDHPYYSWNRTPVQYAVDRGASYLILNDRVLLHGSGYGEDNWVEVRESANAFVAKHAVLAGRVNNSYYGDLEIYRVATAERVTADR